MKINVLIIINQKDKLETFLSQELIDGRTRDEIEQKLMFGRRNIVLSNTDQNSMKIFFLPAMQKAGYDETIIITSITE